MVTYRRRLPNFYMIQNWRVGIDEEVNSSSIPILRFCIDYKMNELSIIDWKQHHYTSNEFGCSEHNIAPIKKLS